MLEQIDQRISTHIENMADMHVHTRVSDGSLTVAETIKLAKKIGLTYLSIVDHDTTVGVAEAIDLGKKNQVTVIPGIEISAYDYQHQKKVHILGYSFNLPAKHINKLCIPIIQSRQKNALWQIDQLVANKYKITYEQVAVKAKDSTCIYKQHIIEVLREQGYMDGSPDFYQKIFKNKGICDREINYVDVFQAITAIKKDGGKAILAHPGQTNSYDLVEGLLGAGLDGIELYHEFHSPQDYQIIRDLAMKHNLILTGGSDFHGAYGGQTPLGGLVVPLDYVRGII